MQAADEYEPLLFHALEMLRQFRGSAEVVILPVPVDGIVKADKSIAGFVEKLFDEIANRKHVALDFPR
jgi:hypothetical protein